MDFIDYKKNKISQLALGGVQFGLDYGISNKNGCIAKQEAKKIINYAQSLKINCFDNAINYASSQEIFGEFLDKKDDLFIFTKISSKNFLQDELFYIDKSLKSLQNKKIFALLLHDSKALSSYDKVCSIKVANLKKSKKIQYFGVSIYDDEEFRLALCNDDIDIIQLPFNLFDLRAIKYDWLKKAQSKNKLIVIRSIYLQGLFFLDENIYKNMTHFKKPLQLLQDFSINLKICKQDLALLFVKSLAKDNILLLGCDTQEQLEQNISCFSGGKYLQESIIQEALSVFDNISKNIYDPREWKI